MLRLAQFAIIVALATFSSSITSAEDLAPIPPIKRLLPPPGIEIPGDVRKELEAKLAELTPHIAKLSDTQHRPDIEVFTKAVAFALRFGEFYDQKDFDKARWALKQAEERLAQAQEGQAPWTKQTGLVVRGYRSSIDGSVQPYGVVVPKEYDYKKPMPHYVFLHGRGDKQTDLHFIHERGHKPGEIVFPDAIVIHPFGRQCIGFKSAGEVDTIDAITYAAISQYPRVGRPVLIGFSMGGAGAWHIGAHYPQHFSAVSPGAGFVDVARYQKLKPDAYPPVYEQKLWGVYDVPGYTRNLFNLPVIAYSGELDKQKDAADFMAESFQKEGRQLKHLIGPKTEHKYHPEVKQELLTQLRAAVQRDIAFCSTRNIPPEAHLQTQTLRYYSAAWLTVFSLKEHWQDSRLDGTYESGRFQITTKNVTRFSVQLLAAPAKPTFEIDGATLDAPPPDIAAETRGSSPFYKVYFEYTDGRWKWAAPFITSKVRRIAGKGPHLQGPIDDAFLDRFLVVLPSGKSRHPRVQQWIDFEVAHLSERWAATFRGELPIKRDTEVTANDITNSHLVCFGDATSNTIIKQALPKLPLAWSEQSLTFNGKGYDAATHMPLMIYPNPLQAADIPHRKYIVLNSGPTFREAHDRTNSLQNPKLPDWAIIDITTPPDAEKPGKVVAADFFDEEWKVK